MRSELQLLSVLSALARLDLDPWQEAAKLARMSRDKAVWRMTALIETLPGNPSTHINSKAIATRLIALLPQQIDINVGAPGTTSITGKSANLRVILTLIILNAIFMAFSFGSQYVKTRPLVTSSNHAQSSVTSKLNPAIPPPQVGK